MKEEKMYRFADALAELMKSKQLDRITVTEIANKCDVTRQIFYHYFEDKYDVITLVYKTEFNKFITMKTTFEWSETILNLINNIFEKKAFYQNAALSDTNETLFNVLYDETINIYRNIIEYRTGKRITPELEFFLDLYCYGGIEQLVKWIRTGMSMPCDKLRDLFFESMPNQLQGVLTGFEVPVQYVLKGNKSSS